MEGDPIGIEETQFTHTLYISSVMSTTHHPVIYHSCTHPELLRATPCPPFAPAFHVHHRNPQRQLPHSMTSPMFRTSYLLISFLSLSLVSKSQLPLPSTTLFMQKCPNITSRFLFTTPSSPPAHDGSSDSSPHRSQQLDRDPPQLSPAAHLHAMFCVAARCDLRLTE